MASQTSGIGSRIARARSEAGLTQVAFAARLGVTSRGVQAWEANDRHPRLDALEQIAVVTGKSVAWFFAVDSPEDLAA